VALYSAATDKRDPDSESVVEVYKRGFLFSESSKLESVGSKLD